MNDIRLIIHAPGAPGLRLLGLGPHLMPCNGLGKLQSFLKNHAFWAKTRNKNQIRSLLAGSKVIISLWSGNRIVGFGRATTDGIYRAVLWDIVVADDLQGKGLGSKVVNALLTAPSIKTVEKIYLMTTHSKEFYLQIGFRECSEQNLLIRTGCNKVLTKSG